MIWSWIGSIVGSNNFMRFVYEVSVTGVMVGQGLFMIGHDGGAALFYQTQSPPSVNGYVLNMDVVLLDATLTENETGASIAVAKQHPGFYEPFPAPDVPEALPVFRLYLYKSGGTVMLICVIGADEAIWIHPVTPEISYASEITYDLIRKLAQWKINGAVVGSMTLTPSSPQNIGARIIGSSASSTARDMVWQVGNVTWQEIVP